MIEEESDLTMTSFYSLFNIFSPRPPLFSSSRDKSYKTFSSKSFHLSLIFVGYSGAPFGALSRVEENADDKRTSLLMKPCRLLPKKLHYIEPRANAMKLFTSAIYEDR
jgi:hypothetical protein